MKALTLFLLVNISFANSQISIENAPTEWLINQTLLSKIDQDGHIKEADKLVKDIFSNTHYDAEEDELNISATKNNSVLRSKMIQHLKRKNKTIQYKDKLYQAWIKESRSAQYPITLYKTNLTKPTHYYINHTHTNLSKDNKELKLLKITPEKTFSLIEGFLRRRNATGTVGLTDHGTDVAFTKVAPQHNSTLTSLRSVEWGGSTHMCLIGIKENWDLLDKGRTFKYEESIKQSRSSEGFRIINHPNKKSVFPYTSWLDADGVEVWNSIVEGAPFSMFKLRQLNNRDALNQWKQSLASGKRHTAVSGTDFHFTIPCIRERTLAYPANIIAGSDHTKTKEALMKGNSSLITRPGAPKLTLEAKLTGQNAWSIMGDEIRGAGKLEVRLHGDFSDTNKRVGGVCYNTINKFHRLFTFWKKRYWQIRFYNMKGEVIAKRTINPKWYNSKKHFKATLNIDIAGTDLVRAEVWEVNKKSKSIDLVSLTNPIYFNRK